jgi:hypothetical protein
MPGTSARRRRRVKLLATGAAVVAVAAGCTWPHHRPPVKRSTTTRPPAATTSTTSTPVSTTTTVAPPTTTTGGHEHGGSDDDKGWSSLMNGHQHGHGEVPLDAATQETLDHQLALTAPLIAKYPTVAQATADGYRRGSPFAPGLGTHFVRMGAAGTPPAGGVGGLPFLTGTGPITDEQIGNPILIFNGNGPEAPLVGFMYMQISGGGGTEPEGFAGPNDHWHYHTNLCVVPTPDAINLPFGADQDVTREQCEALGGRLLPVTGYMLHVWNVPGWENPDGVFAELHPKITCRDGTYYIIPLDKVGTNSTVCRDEAVIE